MHRRSAPKSSEEPLSTLPSTASTGLLVTPFSLGSWLWKPGLGWGACKGRRGAPGCMGISGPALSQPQRDSSSFMYLFVVKETRNGKCPVFTILGVQLSGVRCTDTAQRIAGTLSSCKTAHTHHQPLPDPASPSPFHFLLLGTECL